MKVGQILDRSLRLFPRVFYRALIWFVIIALLGTAANLFMLDSILLGMALSFVQGILNYVLLLAVTLMAAEWWHGNQVSLSDVRDRISASLVFRLLGLSIWIGVVTMLGFLLLIIPGLVYMLNRILAPYVLVVENCSMEYALKKSKYLMTRGKWYSFSGPYMRISGLLFIVMIISWFSGLAAGFSQQLYAQQSLAWYVSAAMTFFSFLLVQFFSVFNYLCLVGFYYDLRARYEGADLLNSIEGLQTSAPAA